MNQCHAVSLEQKFAILLLFSILNDMIDMGEIIEIDRLALTDKYSNAINFWLFQSQLVQIQIENLKRLILVKLK